MNYLIVYAWRRVGNQNWNFENTISETPFEKIIEWEEYKDEEYKLINIIQIPIEYSYKLKEVIFGGDNG